RPCFQANKRGAATEGSPYMLVRKTDLVSDEGICVDGLDAHTFNCLGQFGGFTCRLVNIDNNHRFAGIILRRTDAHTDYRTFCSQPVFVTFLDKSSVVNECLRKFVIQYSTCCSACAQCAADKAHGMAKRA